MVRWCRALLGLVGITLLSGFTGPVSGHAATGRLVVVAEPKHVVLGGDAPEEVALTIEVRDTDGEPSREAQVLVRSTAGTVSDLRMISHGRFRARLLPPSDRFPQLAVINVADVAPVVRGEPPMVAAIGVAYSARIDLRGRAEPESMMRIEVAGKRFGPARVGRDGRFVIPILVPPGVGWANGKATDSLGNSSRSRINLYLPEVRQLHAFVYPEVLIADGQDQGWLFVTTVDATGAPEDVDVEVVQGRGELGAAERLEKGLARRPYRTPSALGNGRDRVMMHLYRGRKNEASVAVDLELMAGAPAAVTVSTTPRYAPADGQSPIELRVEVKDAQGNPASGHEVLANLGPETREAEHVAPGVYRLVFSGRTAIGAIQVPIAVVPRTSQCPRPWAAFAPDRTQRVRDVRGIACQLSFAVLDAEGANPFRGVTSEMGELTLPEAYRIGETRLIVEGVAGGSPDILWVGGDQVSEPVPIFHHTAVVTWRLVSEVTLELELKEREEDRVTVALRARGIPTGALADRLVVQASRGTATLDVVSDTVVEIRIAGIERGRPAGGAEPGPVDVVARDKQTGVSAWLRVE